MHGAHEAVGTPDGATAAGLRSALSAAEFASRFEAASRLWWCIAAAVLGNRRGVEDVVQESAIIAMGKLKDFTPGTSFEHWMGQIVRYTALNEARRNQRRGAMMKPGELMESVADKNGSVGAHHGFDERTVSALNTLEPVARECLLMRTVLDLPYSKIARTLDIPEGTAMSHVFRSRQELRRLLADDAGKGTGR